MRILLAPMEGVVDYEMRDVLTRIGGYDRCVTEFVRVTEQLLPNKIFYRFSPELRNGGVTSSGTPVFLQLLGGNPKYMALNAARVQQLEPLGIDLNFGCPSKTVTRNDGGSALLREPRRIAEIVDAVRQVVDPHIAVTAKVRLGFSNHDLLEEVVDGIVNAGADEICIHARTRADRYKPPAYWSAVKKVSEKIDIPVVINGEIWSIEDAINAQKQSGCQDIMVGRGALTRPDLAASIRAEQQCIYHGGMKWDETLAMVTGYLRQTENKHPLFVSNRLKQWLVFLQRHYPEAKALFHRVKRIKKTEEVFDVLSQYSHNAN